MTSMKMGERLFHAGNKALMNNDPAKAVRLYNRSLRWEPRAPDVLMNKAGAFMDQKY